ncbi:MAG: multiple sugar transport system permease protein [Solirubrobacteraceae bacterium]|jgi:multiple sugar transport system permease protein|nr:multiple sugar transport system permease protein [Solirubrobacteraceae bacterium]
MSTTTEAAVLRDTSRVQAKEPGAGRDMFRLGRWAISIGLIVYTVFLLFPFYWTINTSLKPSPEALAQPPTLLPKEFTTDAYSWLTSATPSNALIDSLVVTVGSTALAVLFGSMAGYAFSRWPRPTGGEEAAFFLLSTRIFPPVAVALPIYFAFDRFRLLDTYTGLILLYLSFGIPLATWLMRSFFDEVPKSFEEAAYLDGYGRLETFFKVTLPLVAPGIVATAILTALFSWNEFLFALIIGGDHVKTYPAIIPTLATGFQVDWAHITALSVAAMVPPVLAVIFLRNHLVRGMSLGAVK